MALDGQNPAEFYSQVNEYLLDERYAGGVQNSQLSNCARGPAAAEPPTLLGSFAGQEAAVFVCFGPLKKITRSRGEEGFTQAHSDSVGARETKPVAWLPIACSVYRRASPNIHASHREARRWK